MEMWLQQLILMLLTVAATAMATSGQTSIILNETQQRVRVPAGSTLELHCCLSTVGYERYRITWHFNNSGPFNNSNKISEKMILDQNSMDDCKNINKTYILSNVNMTNTGWYLCEISVEIPLLRHIWSIGTEVVVSDSEVPTYPSNVTNIKDPDVPSDNWWLWLVLGGSFILLVLAVVCVLLARREENTDEPIYANTRYPNKQPSPRPDMSGAAVRLKTASSSQDLRTPSPARYDEGKRRDKR